MNLDKKGTFSSSLPNWYYNTQVTEAKRSNCVQHFHKKLTSCLVKSIRLAGRKPRLLTRFSASSCGSAANLRPVHHFSVRQLCCRPDKSISTCRDRSNSYAAQTWAFRPDRLTEFRKRKDHNRPMKSVQFFFTFSLLSLLSGLAYMYSDVIYARHYAEDRFSIGRCKRQLFLNSLTLIDVKDGNVIHVTC